MPRNIESLNRKIFELRDQDFTTKEIAKKLHCGTHTIAKCLASTRPPQKSVLEVLNRRNWIKGQSSKDKQGFLVSPNSPTAVKFCLLGALIAAYGWKNFKQPLKKVSGILRRRGHIVDCIVVYNDAPTRTWEDIEELIKEANI